jgi:hypothetical protein
MAMMTMTERTCCRLSVVKGVGVPSRELHPLALTWVLQVQVTCDNVFHFFLRGLGMIFLLRPPRIFCTHRYIGIPPHHHHHTRTHTHTHTHTATITTILPSLPNASSRTTTSARRGGGVGRSGVDLSDVDFSSDDEDNDLGETDEGARRVTLDASPLRRAAAQAANEMHQRANGLPTDSSRSASQHFHFDRASASDGPMSAGVRGASMDSAFESVYDDATMQAGGPRTAVVRTDKQPTVPLHPCRFLPLPLCAQVHPLRGDTLHHFHTSTLPHTHTQTQTHTHTHTHTHTSARARHT